MRVKFRRAAWVANIVLVGSTLPVVLLPVATTNSPAALPLYQFVNSGTGPLPWNAVSFEAAINSTKMLGNPHAASQNGEAALTYRMANSQIALYVGSPNGSSAWFNVSTLVDTPSPIADPVPFFDPMGNVGIVYVSTSNHLILLTQNSARGPRSARISGAQTWQPWISTDLTLATGVGIATGLPSVEVNGLGGFVAARSLTNNAEVIPLSWTPGQRVPTLSAGAINVSNATSLGSITSDPVVLPEAEDAFAAITAAGGVDVLTNPGSSSGAWVVQSLTSLTGSPASAGALAATSTSSTTYLASLSTSGNVELYTTPNATFTPLLRATHAVTATTNPSGWTVTSPTALATGAPPLDGSIFINASPSQLLIAGQAANWGDLFVLTNSIGLTTWSATDVSATGGSAARSVGTGVTGMSVGTGFSLLAAGVSSPPPQGTGVYAIPSSDWGTAITNGWPIISGPGGWARRPPPGWVSPAPRAWSRVAGLPHGPEHLQRP